MQHSLVKEMFTSHLQEVSRLSDLRRTNADGWLMETEHWLAEAEKLMSQFRFTEGGIIAAARGNIVKALDLPTAEGQSPRKQAQKRCRVAAQEALDEAVRLLADRARQSEDRLRAFEEKLCEGLTAYFLQCPVDEGGSPPSSAELWCGLKEYEATRALTLYLETSLGGQDRVYLLERILENGVSESAAIDMRKH